MVVIIRSDSETMSPKSQPSFDFMPESITDEEVSQFIRESFPESNDMETELISDRINRLAPLYLAATVLADMKKQGIDTTEKNFISEFGSIGREYRKALRELENEAGIGRGLRLSDGFPQDESQDTDNMHLRTWTRMYVGASNDMTLGSDGLAQKLGVLDIDENERSEDNERLITLGPSSSDIVGVELPKSVTIKTHKLFSDTKIVDLPEWFDRNDVDRIMHFLIENAKEEVRWMKFVLSQTEAYTGADARDIVNKEIENVRSRKSPSSRWKNQDGESINEFIDRISKSAEDLQEEDREKLILDMLEKRISPTVASTLGRLKELGLVVPYRKGRFLYYKSTDLGKNWIKEFDKHD